MAQVTIPFLQPDYYDQFQCIGGDCRHNCCSYNWRIDIDKKTYKRYRQVTKPIELAQRLKKHIKLIDIEQTTNSYARIEHLKNPIRCPFEMADGLCMIQKELGAEWLSTTCQVFPRYTTIIEDKSNSQLTVERSITSGCEVVVKHFFHHSDEMNFVISQQKMNQNQMDKFVEIRTGGLCSTTLDTLFENYFQSKSIAISILQNRELSFNNRLILLGLFSQKLDQWRCLDGATAYSEMEKFVESIDEKSFAEAFANTKPDFNRQFLVANNLYHLSKASNGDVFGFIDETLKENLISLDISVSDIERFSLRYQEYLQGYEAYMQDKEHFLENLFVNELHHLRFPFIHAKSAYDSYRYLVSLYVLYRYMVCYYMGTRTELTENELIDITVYFGRGIANGTANLASAIEFLDENQSSSLAEMALLIK